MYAAPPERLNQDYEHTSSTSIIQRAGGGGRRGGGRGTPNQFNHVNDVNRWLAENCNNSYIKKLKYAIKFVTKHGQEGVCWGSGGGGVGVVRVGGVLRGGGWEAGSTIDSS